MDRAAFEAYVAAFNARDYETLHSRFFHPEVTLITLGHVLSGQAAIRAFYAFYHAHVDEKLEVVDYQPRSGGFYGEVRMTLTAHHELSAARLAEQGYGRLPAMAAGSSYATTLFIDYRLKDGKLYTIRCAEFPDPQP